MTTMASLNATQKWETVKTGKPKKQALVKKSLPMPIIAPSAPVAETPTMYSEAFGPRINGSQIPRAPSSPQASTQKKPVQKKKPSAPKDKSKKQPLEEALKTVSVLELQDTFGKSKLLFPNNPEVWLLDISGALQSSLEDVPVTDPTFAAQQKGYPLSAVPAALHKELSACIKDCSQATLEGFFMQCVQQVTTAALKGSSSYGFLILVQLLARQKPAAVQLVIPKMQELSRKYQNQKAVCVSILWCAAQIGAKSLDLALKVWMAVMFPLIGLKAMTQYVTDNLHEILMQVPGTSIAEDTLTPEQFVGLMELAHDPPSPVVNAKLSKQVMEDYRKVKQSVFGRSSSGQQMQLFFPHLLAKLNPDSAKANSALSAEVLSLLVACLRNEPACVPQWRRIFFKNLAQTLLLVSYLEEVQQRSSGVDRKLMQSISASLLTAVDHLNRPDDGRLIQLRKQLQGMEETVSRSAPSRWPRYLLLLLLLICGAVAVDVTLAGDLAKSWSGRQLTRAGLMPHVRLVQTRVARQTAMLAAWMRLNGPVYWARLNASVGPVVQAVCTQLAMAAAWLYEVCTPLRLAAAEYATIALEWLKVNGPVWLEFVKEHSMWMWTLLVDWYNVAVSWLLQNVFVGSISPANLQATSSQVLVGCRGQLMTFYSWCKQFVN